MSSTISSLRDIARHKLEEQKQMLSYNLVVMGILKTQLQEKEDNAAFFEIADKLAKLDTRKNKDVTVHKWWEDDGDI